MGARSGVAQTSLHEKSKVMVVVNQALCDYILQTISFLLVRNKPNVPQITADIHRPNGHAVLGNTGANFNKNF